MLCGSRHTVGVFCPCLCLVVFLLISPLLSLPFLAVTPFVNLLLSNYPPPSGALSLTVLRCYLIFNLLLNNTLLMSHWLSVKHISYAERCCVCRQILQIWEILSRIVEEMPRKNMSATFSSRRDPPGTVSQLWLGL